MGSGEAIHNPLHARVGDVQSGDRQQARRLRPQDDAPPTDTQATRRQRKTPRSRRFELTEITADASAGDRAEEPAHLRMSGDRPDIGGRSVIALTEGAVEMRKIPPAALRSRDRSTSRRCN